MLVTQCLLAVFYNLTGYRQRS